MFFLQPRDHLYYRKAADFFGLRLIDARGYPHTTEGLQRYLKDVGIKYTNAVELCTPHDRELAFSLGYALFLPPIKWWHRVIVCGAFMKCRELLNAAIPIPNWWRPKQYNKKVGGASGSDHIAAHAIDLQFHSETDRIKCIKLLNDIDDQNSWLEMSLGYKSYKNRIHIGLNSPRGRRVW